MLRRQRPDGRWVELLRIPGGPVEVAGERRAVPTLWIETEPATVRGYAPFVRARHRAGAAVDALLPEEGAAPPDVTRRQRTALELHVLAPQAADAHLPHEVLAPVPAPAGEAYVAWAGLHPLDMWARERAWQVAAIPVDDLRGGWFAEPRQR